MRLSDLARLYPMEGWPDQSPDAIKRQTLSGPFEPIEGGGAEILAWRGGRAAMARPASEAEGDRIALAVRQAVERLIAERAASWRILSWAGAVSMLLVAISNFFVVAALARLAGLI